MIDAATFRKLALAMPGVTEAPHVDRIAFRARVIFATLPPDGRTANLKLEPADQEMRCAAMPDAFAPVQGGWGRMGWTMVDLTRVDPDALAGALADAWRHASAPPRGRPRRLR